MGRLFPRAAALALALTFAAIPAAQADVGTPGLTYTGASAPTADKPQSKLWRVDGSWWGVLYDRSRAGFMIFERRNGSWVSTGVEVDPRDRSWADVKWDGNHLDVVSAGNIVTDPGMAIRFSRFAYDSATRSWKRDIDPIALTSYGVEGAIVDRDSRGVLWTTFTHESRVYITHTTTSDSTWTTPAILLGAKKNETKVTEDDMSTVVAGNGRTAVLWGDQLNGTYYVALHKDGEADNKWQLTKALSGQELSDDHMNIKSLEADPSGQLFAAVKTSLNAPADPMIMLLVMTKDLKWKSYTVWRIGEGHNTRPQVVIDRAKRQLYVFSTSPCCNGGAIFMKKTNLDKIAFAPGPGTPVLQSSTDTHINNVTSTKQTVDASSGLAILAGDDATRRYWHTVVPLDGAVAAPETEITDGPSGLTTDTHASFSFTGSSTATGYMCSLDGAELTACTSPVAYAALAEGDHVFQVAAVDAKGNVDPSPAERRWTVTAGATGLFSDGFESEDYSNWSAVRVGGEGSVAVQNGAVVTGTWAAQLSSTATLGSYAFARKDFSPAPAALTAGGNFRIMGEGGTGGNVPILRLYDSAGTRLLSLYRPNGGTRVWVSHSGTSARTAVTLPTATWMRFEVELDTAAGRVVVHADGNEVYRAEGVGLGSAGVGRLQIGNETKAQAFILQADNVLVR